MERKCIFITGAASGIGRETALLFARKGWFVGITDVDAEGLVTLETEIGADNCHRDIMDVTDPESTRAAIEAFARETGGRMHLLFNNAGLVKFGRFEDVALRTYHAIIEVNLKGILNCTHYALPCLKKTTGARIVGMASTSAVYGVPELSVYSATKRAVLALTEALDLELERHGIIVSDILVPYVNTPFLEVEEDVYSIQKMGIKIEPLTVARTVWKAAHRKKLHWKIGLPTYALSALFWLLPAVRRTIVRKLTMAPT